MTTVQRALAGFGLLWIAYAGWVLIGGAAANPQLNDLLFLAYPWACAATAWSAARRDTLASESRTAWRLLAIGLSINALTNIRWLFFGGGRPSAQVPLWSSAAMLLYYPFVMTALSVFPTARRLRAEARRRWLDAAVITTGAVALTWYLAWVYTPVLDRADIGETIIVLMTMGGDFVLAYASWTVARAEQDRDARPSMWLLAGAMGAFAVGDTWMGPLQLTGQYHTGALSDVPLSLAYVLLAAAPMMHRRSIDVTAPEERPITARASWWPLAALGLVLVPLVIETARNRALDEIVLLAATVMVVGLEVARQADLRRQNRQLATARAQGDARFRSLVQNSHDMTFVCDRTGRLSYTSPSAPHQLGMGTATLTEGDLLAVVHPADRARVGTMLLDIGPDTPIRAANWRMGADGSWRDVEGFLTDLTGDPAIHGIVLNVRDVSERERLEEQLRQSQKLEAIGSLAGGIAHDFNNILAAVLANAQLLRETAPGPEAQDIEDAARRGATLTRQLLEFSRGEAAAPTLVNIAEVVTAMTPMMGRLLPREIELRADMPSAGAMVLVDRGQLEQVILNLVINARDAMPDGGVIRLEAWSEQGHVVLRVGDTGTGMDAATRARIFEPFFTTKPRGRGTGLGLATVYGIVTKAGGEISVDSLPGAGTRMNVRLPKATGAPARASASIALPVAAAPRVILVVDDEDALRLSIARFLERRGYRVHAARDGLEALSTLAEHEWEVDVVLTDIVMPRLGGIELAERIRSHGVRPAVLCMTGHAGRSFEAAPDAPWHPDQVLIKPFELNALVDRLSTMTAAHTP